MNIAATDRRAPHRSDRADDLARFFADPEAVAEMLASAPIQNTPEWGDFESPLEEEAFWRNA
jgi:hypothetical protein